MELNKFYDIIDDIDYRLKFEGKENVTVKIGNTKLTEGTDYKITYTENATGVQDKTKSGTLTLTFIDIDNGMQASDKIKNNAGEKVQVTFKTTFAKDENGKLLAAMGEQIENQAKLEYTNTSSDNKVVKESEKPEVHTGGVTLYKYYVANNQKVSLAGAKFGIYATEEDAKNNKNVISTAESDEKGIVKFIGLQYGGDAKSDENNKTSNGTYEYDADKASTKYWVAEIEAPAGYQKYSGIIEVTINKDSYNEEKIQYEVENAKLNFDLALRKFITEVEGKEITSRVPQVKIDNGKVTYEHSKDPVTVHVDDTIIYTLRIFNEGNIDGYASEITDDIPEFLEYLPDETTNVEYMWKMYDENGKETSYCRELLLNNGAYNDLNKRQIGIYYAWLALKPYADDLANLVKYSKIDTKKTGKTFAEQQIYYNGMQDLAEESHFAPGEVRRFYDETFIARKTENSIPFGSSIFKNLLFRNTDTFINQYNTVLSLLGRKNNANSKLLNPIISGMEAQLRAEFFNQYVEDNNIDVKGLFYGKNSIAKRLNKFKNMIFKGEYKYLLNTDGTINNDFLNYLLPNITHDGLDFIDTSELLSSDQSQANNLINYWRELLDEIKRLARDLAIYAFYVSGDNPSMNSFFQYLPNSFRKEIGYTDYIQGKLDQLVNGSQLGYKNKTDLFLNNWTNDSLVKPVSMYSGKNNEQLRGVYMNDKAAMPNIIMGQRVGSDKPAIRPINWIKVANQDGVEESFPLFPPYIKLRDGLGFGPQNWHVYTIIGFKSFVETQPSGKPGKTVYIPLYGLISKKGYKRKGHSIVEYGRETEFDFNKENEWVEALNNKDALADMTLQQERQDWIDDAPYIHHITELPSYQNMNYALARQDRVYTETEDDVNMDDEFFPVLEEREEPAILADYSDIKNYLKTYSGIITNLEPNQIFVFGSNTQGRHGKGAALTAKNKFGAVYGQSEGIQGQSYAIITKDLTSSVQPSRTPEQIVEQINKLYTYARQHRDKEFLVAYSGTGTNLNYYSNEDLARMFAKYPIPDNIVFEKSFSELVFKYINKEIDAMFQNQSSKQLDLFPSNLPLTGVELMALYEQGNSRISEVLDQMEDLTPEERQTYLNEFAQFMTDNEVNTQDKLEEALRKFICNL